jgi:hypothetical protein
MTPIASLFAALALASPGTETSPDLGWMAGYWLDCSGGREVSETWSDPRAGLMVGHAVTTQGGRASFEMARIGPASDGVLAYHAQPGGAAPTLFRLIEHGEGRAVFENPDNDFPTRIVYRREGEALHARIEGRIDGEARGMDWRFEAAPLNTRCPG